MKSYLILILALLAPPAWGTDYLILNAGSHHFNREVVARQHLREINPGLGYDHEEDVRRYSLGFYRNSYGDDSFYAFTSYLPVHRLSGDLGLFGGIVTGYEYGIIPALGLTGNWQLGTFGFGLLVTPAVSYHGKHTYGVVGLQLRFRLP